jgi:hypothetical protein
MRPPLEDFVEAGEDLDVVGNGVGNERGGAEGGNFEAGDWNQDGRSDLLYLAGPGYLLLRTEDGFEATPLVTDGEYPEYRSAVMAPIVNPATL